MIKLIASDIDGTLVRDGESKLNDELVEVIDRLHQKGIIFAAASGRSIVSEKQLFEAVGDKIYYIGCNGTYLGNHKECLYRSVIKPEYVKEIVKDCRNYPDCTLFLNIDDGYYTETKDEKIIKWLEEGYREKVLPVDDLLAVEEDIIKACLYDPKCQANITGKALIEKWSDKVSVVTAGTMWLDFFDINASKGTALNKLQEMLGVTKEETMAFGDQQNDIEMLKQAYYSYAIGNAIDEVKQVARFEADTNINNGVLKVLKTLL